MEAIEPKVVLMDDGCYLEYLNLPDAAMTMRLTVISWEYWMDDKTWDDAVAEVSKWVVKDDGDAMDDADEVELLEGNCMVNVAAKWAVTMTDRVEKDDEVDGGDEGSW